MMIEEMQMIEERMYNNKVIKKSANDGQMNGDCELCNTKDNMIVHIERVGGG